MGTLHGLAMRALGRPALAQDKKHLEEWNASHGASYELSIAVKGGDSGGRGSKVRGDELLEACELYRHRQVDLEHWAPKALGFWREWDQWKLDNELMDFTDLIVRAVDYCPTAPGDPAVLIVDEAQDLSAIEFALVQHWGASCEFFILAGDADQAIFAWRGADANAFMSLDIPEENIYRLTVSYRVPRSVQRYASRWIDKVQERYPSAYKPRDEEGVCRSCPGMSLKNSPRLIKSIEEDIAGGDEVMLLATCGYMLNPILKVLRDKGIPFHNPLRPSEGAWNPMRGGVSRLLSFLAPMRTELHTDDSGPRFWSWEELRRWIEPLEMGDDFVRGAKAHVTKRAKNNLGPEPVTRTDLRSILTEEGFESMGTALVGSAEEALEWYTKRIRASQLRLMKFAIKLAERKGLEALAQAPRLIVGTVHSVKGGGVESVYLAPDLSVQGAQQYARRGDRRDELIRLFYVGQTRAKRKLTLLGPSQPAAVKWLPITEPEEGSTDA